MGMKACCSCSMGSGEVSKIVSRSSGRSWKRRTEGRRPSPEDRAMNAAKQASPDHRIHALLAQRWSPYAFADRPVSEADLCALFEAARWAASSYNEQPWSYI